MDAIDLIKEERNRQIQEEGYDSSHDSTEIKGQLAYAALVYACPSEQKDFLTGYWPWDMKYYKPDSTGTKEGRIRELVKAGALICAEIDRLNNSVIGNLIPFEEFKYNNCFKSDWVNAVSEKMKEDNHEYMVLFCDTLNKEDETLYNKIDFYCKMNGECVAGLGTKGIGYNFHGWRQFKYQDESVFIIYNGAEAWGSRMYYAIVSTQEFFNNIINNGKQTYINVSE